VTDLAPRIPPCGASPVVYTKGTYANWEATQPLSKAHFDPAIVGVALSVHWADVQSGPTTYNWSFVDQRLSEAKTIGLKVALALATTAELTPSYILNNPAVQKIIVTDGQGPFTGPVFWDPIYHQDLLAFNQAAGQRFATNPVVAAVVTGFADWRTLDWSVPHDNGQWQTWLNAGWTTQRMLTVGEQVLDTTATAFPTQNIKVAIGTTERHMDGTATTLAADFINYAYGKYPTQFLAQVNALNGVSPVAGDANAGKDPNSHDYLYYLLSQHVGQVGLQMVADATNDPARLNGGAPGQPLAVLQKVTNIGLTYRPWFLEYWTVDGQNSQFQATFRNADTTMLA
jgi:hypothetical protein